MNVGGTWAAVKGWGAGASQQYSRTDKMRRKQCHPAGTCRAMCQGPRLGQHDDFYYPARRRYSQSARAAQADGTSSNKLGTSCVFSVKSSQAPHTLRALSGPHPPNTTCARLHNLCPPVPLPLIPTPRPMHPPVPLSTLRRPVPARCFTRSTAWRRTVNAW